jgi:hypothetical protein
MACLEKKKINAVEVEAVAEQQEVCKKEAAS